MTGKTHTAVGLTSCLVLTALCPETITVAGKVVSPMLGILATIPGSLAPDVDIEGSAASKRVPFLNKFLKHRGITHTLLFPAILYGVMYQFDFSLMVMSQIFGFMFGWLMHIFADLLNKKGVPLFWPLLTSHYHIMTIKTRTFEETLFLGVWCILCAGAYIFLKITI